MEASIIFKRIVNKIELSKLEEDLIEALEHTTTELRDAQMFFEIADDPNLIEYAIYRENAARAKYGYLIMEAKKLNIRSNYRYLQSYMEVV